MLESLLARPGRTLARLIVAITFPNVLLIGVALMSRPAPVQSTDAAPPRPAPVKLLGDSYAEVPVVSGLAQNGRLIESFAQIMRRNRKYQAPERNISPPARPITRSGGNAP